MTGAAHSRPLRFFGLILFGWIAIRLAAPGMVPLRSIDAIAPTAAPVAMASSTVMAAAAAPVAPPALLTRHRPQSVTPPLPLLRPAPPPVRALQDDRDIPIDLMQFINFTVGFANRHYASDADYMSGFPPGTGMPTPAPVAPASTERWHASAWLFWRADGAGAQTAVTVGRLGGSQAGVRVDYELTPHAKLRTVAYGRTTAALQHPAAPEAAIGLSIQPVRKIPLSLAAERRIALGNGGRNANAVMAVGGFGPVAIGPGIEAEGYAQTGIVGFRRGDAFIDGKLSLLSPLPRSAVRVGAALSGGAQSGANRLDIGPEVQVRLPLPQVAARIGIEWRERIAGNARPGSGLTVTLATDF
ncbi:hypothetical protein [Sphingobium sp. CAP-1]|uniref:hypothetical protein n=1 Tax=Sphingobium sp. CAP-1 TaxID=2676077 RepID=UPI0012BB1FF1|nr:hypothetical protein [Sphingobium sp. CAP-1]QGP78022.1 hypothetical protein GL174_02660 [Sphingobium sp. CAP-1]